MFTYDALRCAFALLPATILWGASFPLSLAAGRAADFGGHVARINAINTAGALAGAIAFTLIGIPLLGSHDSQQLLVIIAAVSSLVLLLSIPESARPRRLAVVAAVTSLAFWMVPAVPGQLIAYGRSVNSWDSIARFLYLAEGATASVAVTEGRAGARQFHIAGKVEASDMDIDMRLERMLGHVPALLHPNPKSILIVGVGAGVTAGALSIHPEVERIVICEIEPMVPRSARLLWRREPPRLRRPARAAGLRRRAALPADDRREVRHHHVGSDPSVGPRRGDALLTRIPDPGEEPPDARRRRHAMDSACTKPMCDR